MQKKGLDDDLFLAYGNITEKVNYLRVLRNNGVPISESISNIKTDINHTDIYGIFLQTEDLKNESGNEFTNSFSGPSLAAIFANFYISGGDLNGATSDNKIRFVNSLNDEKIRQLHENLPTSGLQKILKDTLQFTLNREVWRTLK